MYRKYIENLREWVKSSNRKPLMVWGARQTGKTYLIKDLFAEKYYKKKYVYIDCTTEGEICDYICKNVNASKVINYISLKKGIVIDKSTLLIFDEAQECMPVITLMKYFCQEYREIPIIVTGSMVRIKILRESHKRGIKNNKFLFPIGKINQLTIYPLNFEEFLINRNKVLYNALLDSYNNLNKYTDLIHEKSLEVFYEYL